MKILILHNFYQSHGGEDAACKAEMRLLREAGHDVVWFFRSNDEIRSYSFFKKASLAWRTAWSEKTSRELRKFLARETPDIVHFHNTFPLISPSAYYACASAGVPVVQTIHNYRLLCPAGSLFRDGRVCEECLRHSLLRSVAHGCYHDSRLQTAVVAAMLGLHRFLGTWAKYVDQFLVCTEFARNKFLEAGFDGQRIAVKPNFILRDPGPRPGPGQFALFLGRLSSEKGPELLVRAWAKLALAAHLAIAGDGPLRSSLESETRRLQIENIWFTGWLDRISVRQHLRDAKFLIVPSTCYENLPLAIAEAYACGVPVIASSQGSLAEIVHDRGTGLHFKPGDAGDLAAKVEWAWTHPAEMESMGHAARREFETKYSPAAALRSLERAYELAREHHAKSASTVQHPLEANPHSRAKHMHEAG